MIPLEIVLFPSEYIITNRFISNFQQLLYFRMSTLTISSAIRGEIERYAYKGPVKLIKRVKIAHSLLQSVSDQFHVIVSSLPM